MTIFGRRMSTRFEKGRDTATRRTEYRGVGLLSERGVEP